MLTCDLYVALIQRSFSPYSRYSWSGEPLFLTCPTSEVTELPACSYCGARRIFEFQLMPALVSMLRSANLGKGPFIYLSLWVSGTNLGLVFKMKT